MTAFVGVAVVPMDSERVLPRQTVLVRDGRIVALGPAGEVTVPTGAVRIDGQGKYLIPGLADMHVHISFVQRPQTLKKYDSTDAERRLLLWLANGVTTVRNMDHGPPDSSDFYLSGEALLRLRARAAAGEILSPRIYTAGPLLKDRRTAEVPPESVATYVAAYKAAGYDFLKVRQEAPAIVESLTVAARRVGIPFAGHVQLRLKLEWALQAGYASIEHMAASYTGSLFRQFPPPSGKFPPLSDSAYWTAARPTIHAIAAATKRAKVWSCPTLAVGTAFRNLPFIKPLAEEGAGLLLGTDAPYSPRTGTPDIHGPPDLVHEELRLMVEAGLTPYQALVAGTRNPAVFLGWDAESGTIAVGKRADVVLLRGNPLHDIANTRRPAGVMIGGRWLPNK